jgi:hypothetical protein
LNKTAAITALVVSLSGMVLAQGVPPEITIEVIGTKKPTSFTKQFLVHIENPAYTPMNMLETMSKSALVVDGKVYARVTPYRGQPGIPPLSEWLGCLAPDDFGTTITPGKHKVSLRVVNGESMTIPVRWDAPVDWHQGNLKSRLKELNALSEVLVDGLPRDCAERWLTVKDGGQQEEDKVRYFLEPQFKISLPYRQMYDPAGLRAVVDGPAKVYEEARLHD